MRLLLLPLLCFLFPCALAAAEHPNILLMFTDDQGYQDVGSYGAEFPTPHIDSLAEDGVRFTQWYSASSICTPSRFGLLTGRNPSRSEHRLLSALMFMADEHKATGIQPGETTIASVLQAGGYDTALIGKWHLGHGSPELLPTRHGFDTFIGHTGGCIDFFTMTYGVIPDWYHGEEHVSENGYATDLIGEEAAAFLGGREGDDPPFFLYLAWNAPHFGKGWSPGEGKPVNLMQPQAADLQRVDFIEDKVRREFAAMTTSLDDNVGRVLAALDESGKAEETLVIFLTDHGGDYTYGGSNRPLRGDKAQLFEGGIRVPCIMRWPGELEAGRVEDAVCSSLDLFPTFATLAGAELDEGLPLDGRDLGPLLSGDDAAWPARTLFWETGAHAELGRSSWSAVRMGDWKYVETPEDGEFVFNLAEDPNETADLAESQPERLDELRALRTQKASEFRPGE